jgi:hypothetical protein
MNLNSINHRITGRTSSYTPKSAPQRCRSVITASITSPLPLIRNEHAQVNDAITGKQRTTGDALC